MGCSCSVYAVFKCVCVRLSMNVCTRILLALYVDRCSACLVSAQAENTQKKTENATDVPCL